MHLLWFCFPSRVISGTAIFALATVAWLERIFDLAGAAPSAPSSKQHVHKNLGSVFSPCGIGCLAR